MATPCRHRGGQRCCQSLCRCRWACPPLPSGCCTGTELWSRRCRWNIWSLPRTALVPPRRSPSGFSPQACRDTVGDFKPLRRFCARAIKYSETVEAAWSLGSRLCPSLICTGRFSPPPGAPGSWSTSEASWSCCPCSSHFPGCGFYCKTFSQVHFGHTCAVFSDEKKLPDDFSQIIFHLPKIGSFFWILIPAAFYQGVHLRAQKGYLLHSTTEAADVTSPLILSLKPCQSSDRAWSTTWWSWTTFLLGK